MRATTPPVALPRQVRAAAKLKHPNIVAAHDADQAGGLHFLVMEYIDGATLAEVIESLEKNHPGISARVLDDTGKLRRFVNVYVNDDDVRFSEGLITPVADKWHESKEAVEDFTHEHHAEHRTEDRSAVR